MSNNNLLILLATLAINNFALAAGMHGQGLLLVHCLSL
jgi:hypothetical protein